MDMTQLLDRIARLDHVPADVPRAPAAEVVAFTVRWTRELRNWKQETLAGFACVSLSTLERVERAEKVSTESLDRIALALGFEAGAFTVPRLRISRHDAQAQFVDEFGHLVPVEVAPLRKQAQVRALACCHLYIVAHEALPETYDDDVRALTEWLDLASFVLSDNDGDGRRRELYRDILQAVGHLERRGVNVLAGTLDLPPPYKPGLRLAIVSLTPKLTDPGASKRREVFVDMRRLGAPQWPNLNDAPNR